MNEHRKIYTKTGDAGETSLIGGCRVPKFHICIEAYGAIDELNSYIGLIRDQQIDKHYKDILFEIQGKLFITESLLAREKKEKTKNIHRIKTEDISLLETEIDLMNKSLPELLSFILPGGHTTVSYCHIARCICRRAERIVTLLSQNHPVDELILKYLNRLSDYLFVLARKIAMNNNVPEIYWKPQI
jgi:cob(I)alamin adenosyltransferase